MIERANALPFGLASYVFSNDAERAQRTAERIERAWSASTRCCSPRPRCRSAASRNRGYGREGGSLGIKDYLEPKFIRHKLIRTG